MRSKKAQEKEWIRQFCDLMQLCVEQINCDEKQEKPDAFVILRRQQRTVKVGVEVTEYHSDRKRKKGSLGRELASNWEKVLKAIMRDARAYEPLRHVTGCVALKQGAFLPGRRDAKTLGRQLVESTASQVPAEGLSAEVTLKGPFPACYPLMNAYVAELVLRPTKAAQWVSWTCSHVAGFFRLDPTRLKAIVCKKEHETYDWKDARERWLLIVAGADPAALATLGDSDAIEEGSPPETLASEVFDRVVLLEAAFRRAREVWRDGGRPALAANRPSPEPRT